MRLQGKTAIITGAGRASEKPPPGCSPLRERASQLSTGTPRAGKESRTKLVHRVSSLRADVTSATDMEAMSRTVAEALRPH